MSPNSPHFTGPGPFARIAQNLAEITAPRLVERRIARAYCTPRGRKPSPQGESLPAPDRESRVATGDSWVKAWRWGDGPAVLLVHGWEDDHHGWDHVIARLREQGQPVVAFDLPAHGGSGGKVTAMPDAARAIKDVAAALGPVRAVIGHSFGAAAAAFALADGLSVERVALVSPTYSMARQLDVFMLRAGITPARREGIHRELRRMTGADLETIDLGRVAPTLKIPALILHSLDDPMIPLSDGMRLSREWPGASFVPLDGLGHRRMLKNEPAIQQMTRFVAPHATAGAETAAA